MKKRILIALAVASLAFVSVFAMAASLNVTSPSLGADSETVSSCDTDGVSTTYGNSFSSGSYKVTSVTVSGIADACGPKGLKVTLATAAGAAVGGEGTVATLSSSWAGTADARTVTVTLASAADASSVEKINVVIG
jgi:hypothetical protein